jgi:hypothetical protein
VFRFALVLFVPDSLQPMPAHQSTRNFLLWQFQRWLGWRESIEFESERAKKEGLTNEMQLVLAEQRVHLEWEQNKRIERGGLPLNCHNQPTERSSLGYVENRRLGCVCARSLLPASPFLILSSSSHAGRRQKAILQSTGRLLLPLFFLPNANFILSRYHYPGLLQFRLEN